jgi:transcriptional regulator with XRE-family HTH domain
LRVRQLRQERNLTLENASAAANLDITHLQKIEAGKVNVSMVTLIRLADGLGVDVVDLFDFSGASKNATRPIQKVGGAPRVRESKVSKR